MNQKKQFQPRQDLYSSLDLQIVSICDVRIRDRVQGIGSGKKRFNNLLKTLIQTTQHRTHIHHRKLVQCALTSDTLSYLRHSRSTHFVEIIDIVAKLFFTYKSLSFANDEVRAGCPQLGLITLFPIFPEKIDQKDLGFIFFQTTEITSGKIF